MNFSQTRPLCFSTLCGLPMFRVARSYNARYYFINHMNLVRVWGNCSDGPHRILVSECFENGSLDKILFGSKGSEILLGSKQRFDIALGVARALAYLHHE
jgi:serine/threonine protein kinase